MCELIVGFKKSRLISFPTQAVKLVKVRAEAMQKASERIGSGMLTVFLAHDSDLKQAIKTAKEYCLQRRNIQDPVCGVANYLFPECKVLAGHEEVNTLFCLFVCQPSV